MPAIRHGNAILFNCPRDRSGFLHIRFASKAFPSSIFARCVTMPREFSARRVAVIFSIAHPLGPAFGTVSTSSSGFRPSARR
jgi:hypothetical protein